ncbi:MAG: MFS transporter [Eubacterium sp.]|nr:MFS transporter [Eubacterium sp.]
MPTQSAITDVNARHLKMKEWILYLCAVFFYTNMTGMMGSYRNAYLVNVLRLTDNQAALFNGLISVIPFFMNFFISMYIDGRKMGKKGKFRPLALSFAIPTGVCLVLTFWTPPALTGTLLMVYITAIALGWALCTNFCSSVDMVSFVMTPNMKERDEVISFRGISSAVGNSAPLVIILVIGLFIKDEGTKYIVTAALCAVIGTITVLLGMNAIKERVSYTAAKQNPFKGFKDILTNKYAWVIIISEFLKTFRNISTFMGVFLAAALLGSTDKFLLFGLPTGIGTAVGMLLINFLLKKFNSKVLYIASGIYSVLINIAAFTVGYIYFQNGSSVLQIVFIVFLFLIGLQFGASNLLPNMFKADVLEDIELKSGKRLDATLPFIIGIGTLISGTIANVIAPKVLYGTIGGISIIGYVQPTDLVPNPEQSLRTKILMLFFYTVVHGLMMFLAGVPFFFYKFTGKTKEDVHNAVIALREKQLAEGNAVADTDTQAQAE